MLQGAARNPLQHYTTQLSPSQLCTFPRSARVCKLPQWSAVLCITILSQRQEEEIRVMRFTPLT